MERPIEMMATTVHVLIARLGETDQLFLTAPTVQLAQERADLRQQLARYSVQTGEQLYLLGEAAVLLETTLVELDDVPTHAQVSGQLAGVYLQFYQLTQEQKYLTIVGQILRPLSGSLCPAVLLGLARLDAARHKPALTRHWLGRLLALPDTYWTEVVDAPEFAGWVNEPWFIALPHTGA
jgi:hypothetical protein